ncbi:MAG: hypothetical protein NUV82_00035 [Candidatus Komeilibacteria bacterium]|nr:hypothetical protein [Candidatus Komeilibacteria bacterium]
MNLSLEGRFHIQQSLLQKLFATISLVLVVIIVAMLQLMGISSLEIVAVIGILLGKSYISLYRDARDISKLEYWQELMVGSDRFIILLCKEAISVQRVIALLSTDYCFVPNGGVIRSLLKDQVSGQTPFSMASAGEYLVFRYVGFPLQESDVEFDDSDF